MAAFVTSFSHIAIVVVMIRLPYSHTNKHSLLISAHLLTGAGSTLVQSYCVYAGHLPKIYHFQILWSGKSYTSKWSTLLIRGSNVKAQLVVKCIFPSCRDIGAKSTEWFTWTHEETCKQQSHAPSMRLHEKSWEQWNLARYQFGRLLEVVVCVARL